MFDKFAEAVFAYCVAILELFSALFKRAHALIGLGVPLLILVGVHFYLPQWVEVGVVVLIMAPAMAAAITVVAHGLLLTRRR